MPVGIFGMDEQLAKTDLEPKNKKPQDFVRDVVPYVARSVRDSRRNARLAKTSWWKKFHDIFATEAEALSAKLLTLEAESRLRELAHEDYVHLCMMLKAALPAVRRKIKKTKCGTPSPQSKALRLYLDLQAVINEYLCEEK